MKSDVLFYCAIAITMIICLTVLIIRIFVPIVSSHPRAFDNLGDECPDLKQASMHEQSFRCARSKKNTGILPPTTRPQTIPSAVTYVGGIFYSVDVPIRRLTLRKSSKRHISLMHHVSFSSMLRAYSRTSLYTALGTGIC